MFNFWIQRKQHKKAAAGLYEIIVKQARQPAFYKDMFVPDDVDGRFDLILVHAFLVHHRIKDEPKAKQLGQALFDHTFKEMDKTLREMGIGDLSVPRHMKHMMKSYKGRITNYGQAAGDDKALAESLRRNLYRKLPSVPDDVLALIVGYINDNIAHLAEQDYSMIEKGHISFKGP